MIFKELLNVISSDVFIHVEILNEWPCHVDYNDRPEILMYVVKTINVKDDILYIYLEDLEGK